jgi:hypothetical protein
MRRARISAARRTSAVRITSNCCEIWTLFWTKCLCCGIGLVKLETLFWATWIQLSSFTTRRLHLPVFAEPLCLLLLTFHPYSSSSLLFPHWSSSSCCALPVPSHYVLQLTSLYKVSLILHLFWYLLYSLHIITRLELACHFVPWFMSMVLHHTLTWPYSH